jgi:hypothetical protein
MALGVQGWSRRIALALTLGAAAWCICAPASAQIRRPAQRPAKKGIVQQPNGRPRMAAEDFIMRLVEMPPERRRALLDNSPRFRRLPEPERRRILSRLEQIDKMPPAEREQLLERYHLFSRLDPQKRERARELYGEWVKLDPPRRRMMTRAVARLRAMEPGERAKTLESQPFADRFDENERKLIGEIASLAPGPAAEDRDR